MDERQRQEFFKRKRIRAIGYYRLGKICRDCGVSIVDTSKSGYCRRCVRKTEHYKIITKYGESKAHRALKEKANDFLMSLGCEKTNFEARVDGKRIDVLGILNGKKIAVECGGSQYKKLYKLLYEQKLVDEFYIWPYGRSKPYRWHSKVNLCPQCGSSL